MNFASLPRRTLPHWPLAMLSLLCAGCEREQIRAYTVPKDKPAAGVAVRPRPITRPQLEWKLPPGWQETGSGQMSIAGFSITGPAGQQAEVSITPLPPMKGREAMIVNMWREQAGLEPLSDEESQKQFQPVDVGGEQGLLFELNGGTSNAPQRRIITAMVHQPDSSLFYKLSGDAALVEAQKPVFLSFLKSIQAKSPTTAIPTAKASATFNWLVPAQWKQQPAGEMQVARFDLPERSGAKAEVFVSVFGSDTGGTLANVNRWRRELGLRDTDDAGLPPMIALLDPAEAGARLVDLTNNNRRLVAAIVPRDGQFWFYKMRGDAAAVTPERDAFVAFVKSKP